MGNGQRQIDEERLVLMLLDELHRLLDEAIL